MSRHSAENITHLLVIVISPILIMLLVGSLIFFLTHVFYDGDFPARLRFVCAMFVLATVLIARISIEEGREYASMYAIPLAVLTVLAIMKFTDAGLLIVLPLIGFIWWSTDKLTWDCTVIAAQEDASGEGLLQTVGLDGGRAAEVAGGADRHELLDREATTDSAGAGGASLWQQWIQKRRRHHTPGEWVIYFGIAAVPAFGLGQWLLPASARGHGLVLLCLFVASALGLLMTTSFMQLRRYLLQRRLTLPEETPYVWLATGGSMIFALMFVGLLLPRPHTGFSMLDAVSQLQSRNDLRASPFGAGEEGIRDNHPLGNGDTEHHNVESDAAAGRQGTQNGKSGHPSSEERSSPDRQQTQWSDSAGERESESRGSPSQDDEATLTGGVRSSRAEASDGGPRQRDPTSDDRSAGAGRPASGSPRDDGQNKRVDASPGGPRSRPQRVTRPPTPMSPWQHISLGGLAKWIYLALIALLVAYVLFRYWREILAAMRAFLRDLAELWSRLFGGGKRKAPDNDEPPEEVPSPRRAFSEFQDPFATGWAARVSLEQLVSYSFEALQAWAEEHGCGRLAEQTPLEFATQIEQADPRVGPLAQQLAVLYSQAAYAPGRLDPESVSHVSQLWSALRIPEMVHN